MRKFKAIVEIEFDDEDLSDIANQCGRDLMDINPEEYLFGTLQNEFGCFDILEFNYMEKGEDGD